MSWSLVDRALELFDAELPAETQNKKESKDRGKAGGVGTQRQGIRKAAKQKQRQQEKRSEAKKQIIQKQVVNALEEYKKHIDIDNTDSNIKLLRKIDRRKAPEEFVGKITTHHAKELERKGGSRDIARKRRKGGKNKKEETSVFTDEDFEKLNKEWLRLY